MDGLQLSSVHQAILIVLASRCGQSSVARSPSPAEEHCAIVTSETRNHNSFTRFPLNFLWLAEVMRNSVAANEARF
jgi:hypothetical protein